MSTHMPQPILHVVVVGFHHKKGCQVEYAYPPLIEGQPVDSHEVPSVWKHLPSLALPDGAHNFIKDTVYFHLPSQEDRNSTVYGVSCYRQIDAKDIVNRSSEVTRNTVQKCVCVLSRLPLYGVIEAKLEMITYAWFSEKDFSQVTLLEETYRQLCSSCNQSMLEGSQVFHGVSCKDLVLHYKHNVVLLFKLLLLERKVLVFGSPVKPVCSTILALLSLFPDMVEYGLKESAAYDAHQQVSPTLRNVKSLGSKSDEDFLEIHYSNDINDQNALSNLQQTQSPINESCITSNDENCINSKQATQSIAHANNNKSSAGENLVPDNREDKSSQNNNNKEDMKSVVAPRENIRGSGDEQSPDSSNSTLLTPPSSSHSSGGTTPGGGVKEKSENEGLEKHSAFSILKDKSGQQQNMKGKSESDLQQHREATVIDSQLCNAQSSNCVRVNERELGVDSVTRVVSVQSTSSSSNQSILEGEERVGPKTDVLEFVEDVTRVERVQVESQQLGSENEQVPIFSGEEDLSKKSQNTSLNNVSSPHTPTDLMTSSLQNEADPQHRDSPVASEETLTSISEGTASDFGTVSSHMEELLETEEDVMLNWNDEHLMLAINSSELASPVDFGVKKPPAVERTDSTQSWASQASSVASDLGEASVKVISDIKSKLTSMWVSAEEGDDTMVESDKQEPTCNNESVESCNEPGADEVNSLVGHTIHRLASLPQVHQLTTSDHSDATQHNNHKESDSKTPSPKSSPTKSAANGSGDQVTNSIHLVLPPLSPTTLKLDECGFPIASFTKGVLCHPYLSLQYYDILQDVNVRGFVIGASNMLFKQKRNLLDALIEIDDVKIEIHDESLRRQLVLTTADLRFAEYLVKSVSEEKGDVFLDETEWEGGDEWLRGQFKLYLASLLVTLQKGDDKLKEDFNSSFVAAYKTTNSYRVWMASEHKGLKEAPPGHPFHGQMSMQDVRMKFAHMMGNTEKGKKFMAAAGQTGKVAVQTGKAIGGAISSAKSAVSGTVTGWFSSLRKWSSTDGNVTVENDQQS